MWVGVDWGVGVPAVWTSGLHVSSSLGTVEVKMSRMHRHALCHISGENWDPLETTRFSRQLVPDLASCSLSASENEEEWTLRKFQYNRPLFNRESFLQEWKHRHYFTRFSSSFSLPNLNEFDILPCWTHHNKCKNMSSRRTSDRTSKYCVNTSTTAYRAWLHVVVIHSDFCKEKWTRNCKRLKLPP